MRSLFSAGRWDVVLCLAAILLAALIPVVTGLLFVFLVPVWFFFAAITAFLIPSISESCLTQRFPALPVFSPRPPPIR
jgi:hypothetical protein